MIAFTDNQVNYNNGKKKKRDNKQTNIEKIYNVASMINTSRK
jgi:hypothetical protein